MRGLLDGTLDRGHSRSEHPATERRHLPDVVVKISQIRPVLRKTRSTSAEEGIPRQEVRATPFEHRVPISIEASSSDAARDLAARGSEQHRDDCAAAQLQSAVRHLRRDNGSGGGIRIPTARADPTASRPLCTVIADCPVETLGGNHDLDGLARLTGSKVQLVDEKDGPAATWYVDGRRSRCRSTGRVDDRIGPGGRERRPNP